MKIVVADTSPIRYLILIGQINILPSLFEAISVPIEVVAELRDPSAPPAVRDWIQTPPAWLSIHESIAIDDPLLVTLDLGERSAISLGIQLDADVILIDERAGAAVAVKKGFETTGTLGVLELAALNGLIDFVEVFDRLKMTNFRYPNLLAEALLSRHRKP